MSTYRLDRLFSPRSVAVVGGSPRPTSPGHAVIRNLKAAHFSGRIDLVNPHYPEIEGVGALPPYDQLKEAPDLAVIAAPGPAVPGIVKAAAEKGTAAAIIITAGLGHGPGSLAAACEQAARAACGSSAMAFLALDTGPGDMLGVVRLHANSSYDSGEYAILLRSDLEGQGLGWQLMQLIIEYARAEGLSTIEGQVLSENTTMLAMCRELGFEIATDPSEPDTCVVKLRTAP